MLFGTGAWVSEGRTARLTQSVSWQVNIAKWDRKMLIPSAKLHSALLQTSFGLFWEETEPHKSIVLAPKLPTDIIKHIYLGVSVYLSTGFLPIRGGLAMCSTLAVADDPDAMFFIQRTHDPSDTELLARFYEQRQIELHPFDELNRNIASFKCEISVPFSKVDQLRRITPLVRELSDEERLSIFRHLEEIFAQDASPLKEIELTILEKESPFWHHVHIPANAPINEPKRFNQPYFIGDEDQGKQLEINLARLLSSVFDENNLFASPFGVTQDTENREFTDLLAVDSAGLLVIEAKAKAVTTESLSQNNERRVKNIAKQVEKALRQLRGAYREALQEKLLTLRSQTEIRQVALADLPIHLIVLVSENHPDLAKMDIPDKVIELGEELGVGVHIFDLNGLSKLIRRCRDTQELMSLLDRRWEIASEHRVIKFADEWLA